MLKNYLQKHGFIRNVLTLMTGTTIAQIITIAISPILTRLYTPEDFGVFALYMSIVSALAVIATAGYEMAIMLPENEKDALSILVLSIFLTFIISSLILLLIIVLRNWIISNIFNDKISNSIFLIPLFVFLIGTYRSLQYWSNRQKKFKRIAKNRVIQAITNSLINIGSGIKGMGYIGFITAGMVAQFLTLIVLFTQSWRNIKNIFFDVTAFKIRDQAKKYIEFPKVYTVQSSIDNIGVSGKLFIITNYFSVSSVGFYSLAERILKTPLTIIGSSISDVLYQKTSSLYNNKVDIQPLVKKLVLRLFIISIPVFVVIFVFAPSLFGLVFGEKWREVGSYIQIMAPWLCLNFIASSISLIPAVIKRQSTFFYFGLCNQILTIGTFIICGCFYNDIKIALQVLAILLSLVNLIAIIWIIKSCNYYRLFNKQR